jgi:Na+/H+ antiporter NhaD/arsenite permease-like protein
MFAATTTVSAFMNNTPLVAVMIPVVERWCRDNRMPVSKFMIPLRWAAAALSQPEGQHQHAVYWLAV